MKADGKIDFWWQQVYRDSDGYYAMKNYDMPYPMSPEVQVFNNLGECIGGTNTPVPAIEASAIRQIIKYHKQWRYGKETNH